MSNNNCKVKVNGNAKAFNALQSKLNMDWGEAWNVYQDNVEMVDGKAQFTKAFVDWFRKEHPNKKLPSLNTNHIIAANAMVARYNGAKGDVSLTARNESDVDRVVEEYDFNSVEDYNFCKRFVALDIARIIRAIYANNEKLDNGYDAVIDRLLNDVSGNLCEDIAKVLGVANVDDVYDNIYNYIYEYQHKELTSVQKNKLALFNLLVDNFDRDNTQPVYDFIKQSIIENASLMQGIQIDKINKDLDEETDTASDEEDVNHEDATGADPVKNIATEVASAIATYNNHDNLAGSFTSGIAASLRIYCATLPKLTSGEKYDVEHPNVNTDNALGVVDVMDFNTVYNILCNGEISYINAEAMINDIARVAKNITGLEGFAKLASDLSNNNDFCRLFYLTFSRARINKMELHIDENDISVKEPNQTIDRKTSLEYSITDDLNRTLGELDIRELDGIGNKSAIDVLKEIGKLKLGLASNLELMYGDWLCKIAARLIPTFSEYNVRSYIHNNEINGKVSVNDNIKQLVNSLQHIVNNIETFQRNRLDKRKKIANALNAVNSKTSDNILLVDGEQVDNSKDTKDPIMSLEEAYAIDIIPEDMYKGVREMANQMLHFCVVKTQLNDYNVHGNLQSNIINSSMMTFIDKIMHDKEALQTWIDRRKNLLQYKYSNLMSDLLNEDGSLKDKAGEMIKTSLFGGAINNTTNEAVTYSEMSYGDFVTTVFNSYFNSDAGTANYFMRTPSDAPKTFVIKAAKVKTDGLIKYDQTDQDSKVNDIINGKFTELTYEQVNKVIGSDAFTVVKERDLISVYDEIINGNFSNIYVDSNTISKMSKVYSGNTDVQYAYCIKVDGSNVYVVLNGQLKSNNNKTTFIPNKDNALVGMYSTKPTAINSLKELVRNHTIENLRRSGAIKRVLNVNHPMYKQLRNMFMQEVATATQAFDYIFNPNKTIVNDGHAIISVNVDTDPNSKTYGKIKINKDLADESGTELSTKGKTSLYEGLDYNGKLYTVSDSGKRKLTGRLFSSDRFIVDSVNHMQPMFDEMIDFLDGTDVNGRAVEVTIDDKNNITGIVLNQQQEEKFNECITNYVTSLIDNTVTEIDEMYQFIGYKPSVEQVTDFVINYAVHYAKTNDMYDGDSKCYKSVQELLKREKETQASGVPNSLVDVRNPYSDSIIEGSPELQSNLDTAGFEHIDKDGNHTAFDVHLRSGFKAITVANATHDIEIVDKENNPTWKKLRDNAINDGLSEKTAEERADELIEGYKQVTADDAQSYISFKEWVRRVTAWGQFKKYEPLIRAILDESKPIDVATIKEFVQVQKNFYYDMKFDSRRQLFVPRQIKNAEYVIIPRLVKGTQLERMAQIMERWGIDQINTAETSKAAKNNILTLWDNEGKISDDIIADLDNNTETTDFTKQVADASEIYSYNYLYRQQETPQHLADENKAGIQFTKKILDNIDEDSPLWYHKQNFIAAYCANIKSSYKRLMKDLNIPLDEDGHIKVEEDGTINGISFQKFFDKLFVEASRQNLDSNSMEFITLAKDAMTTKYPETLMPMYLSNMSTKLELIAQSIFNRSVTRQMLPGFHAAQVSDIGFRNIGTKHDWVNKNDSKDVITAETYQKLSPAERHKYRDARVGVSDKLHYHRNGEPYIEVMLPKSNFNFKRERPDGTLKTDDELLEELQNEGLDKIIGYRIPTEGKQSMAVMKVVGFIDDACGSTIIVPDGWVGQTGSDFDIDSVYGIHWSTYIDNDGHIRKVRPKTEYNKYDWYRLINKLVGSTVDNITDEEFDEIKSEVKSDIKEKYNNIIAEERERDAKLEQELYDKLPDLLQNAIKQVHIELYKLYGKTDTRDKFLTQLVNVRDLIEQNEDRFNGKDVDNYHKYILDKIDDLSPEAAAKRRSQRSLEYSTEIKARINERIAERDAAYEEAAKALNIPSLDDFENTAPEDVIKNSSRSARNNVILSSAIAILESKNSLEENLSRSNFDALTDARDLVEPASIVKRRNGRSAYSVIDQAKYMYDAMSGAKLKAFSVTRDTFCSICNTVKAVINEDFRMSVVLDLSLTDKNGKPLYNLELIKNAIGDNIKYNEADNTVTLTLDKFGWSNNNKNIMGMILTSYSSQTTAHILDAIKKGAIMNENDYTFSVFKTFPDVGLDYITACSFLAQPAITRIVNNYNANNSIYIQGNYNPIHATIKELAAQLGKDVNQFTPIDTVIGLIRSDSKFWEVANDVIGEELEVNNTINLLNNNFIKNIKFNTKMQLDRLNKRGMFTNEYTCNVYDVLVSLQFMRMKEFGDRITDCARVCNPDKFGAKQSIYATNKVFDDITELVDNSLVPLSVDGKAILNAIYPGINSDVNKYLTSFTGEISAYPTLDMFLRSSTAPSIVINRLLFKTQQPEFRSIVNDLVYNFTNGKQYFTEKGYKDYENYILNSLYRNTDFIKFNFRYRNGSIEYLNDETYLDDATRIYGFNRINDYSYPVTTVVDGKTVTTYKEFKCTNFKSPVEEEVTEFTHLSPVQKIKFVLDHTKNDNIFSHLDIRADITRGKNAGRQTLRFNSETLSVEEAHRLFDAAISNTNPYYQLAAMDMIKYAFVVEGFRNTPNSITRIISNDYLRSDKAYNIFDNGVNVDLGSGIITELNHYMTHPETLVRVYQNELEENYIRGHYTDLNIALRKVTKRNKRFELDRKFDIITIDTITDAGLELATKYNMVYSQQKRLFNNKYCRLSFEDNNSNILYKVHLFPNRMLYAYPLNKLEANENKKWSSNVANNKYKSSEFYEKYIENLAGLIVDSLPQLERKKWIENSGIKDYLPYKKSTISSQHRKLDITQLYKIDPIKTNLIVNSITKYFTDITDNPDKSSQCWFSSQFLENYFAHGEKVQEIALPINGSIRLFTIKQVSPKLYSQLYNSYNKGKLQNASIRDVIEQKRAIGNIRVKDMFYAQLSNNDPIVKANAEKLSVISDEQLAENSFASIKSMATEDHPQFKREVDKLIQQVGSSSQTAGKHNIRETINTTAKIVDIATKETITSLDDFYILPDDTHLAIDDARLIPFIRDNKELRTKFLKTILFARSISNRFNDYKSFTIDSNDAVLLANVNNIKDNVNKLESNSRIDKALKMFAEQYLIQESDNPLFGKITAHQILTMLDGYHSSSSLNAWINDLQEAPNTLIQIVAKKVMADLDTQQMLAKKRVAEFQDKINKIMQDAVKSGTKVDWDNIIKDGIIARDFTQEFVNISRDYEARLKEIANNNPAGKSSWEYAKLNLEYDEWLVEHVNRQYVDEYYKAKNSIIREMLMPNEDSNLPEQYKAHRLIFEEYNKLIARRGTLWSWVQNYPDNEAYRKEYDKVREDIAKLLSNSIEINGKVDSKDDIKYPGDNATDEQKRYFFLNSSIHQQALVKYVNALKELENTYFERTPIAGFEEALKRNLDIISSIEKANPNVPISTLMANDEYKKAKDWLKLNAEYDYASEFWDEIRSIRTRRKYDAVNDALHDIVIDNDAYDAQHIVDATKFSDKDIARLKAEEERYYEHHKTNKGAKEGHLIKNGIRNTVIYTTEFYNRMSTTGELNPEYGKIVKNINQILATVYDDVNKIVRTWELSLEQLNELNDLYAALGTNGVKKYHNATDAWSEEARKHFIKNHVSFKADINAYRRDELEARNKADKMPDGKKWLTAWYNVAKDTDEFRPDNAKDDDPIPNHLLYGYVTPIDKELDKYTDKEATDDNKRFADMVVFEPTKYYLSKRNEMQQIGGEQYKEWYDANHVYNPYTGEYEPLRCWTTIRPNPNYFGEASEGIWKPNWTNSERKPKEEGFKYKNVKNESTGKYEKQAVYDKDTINYEKDDAGNYITDENGNKILKAKVGDKLNNYKKGSGYDNNVNLNKYERQVRQIFIDTLNTLCKTEASKKFISTGRMPAMLRKDFTKTDMAKEVLKMIGTVDTSAGVNDWINDNQMNFEHDKTMGMPMLNLLGFKESKWNELYNTKPKRPIEDDFTSIDDYNKALQNYNVELEKYNKAVADLKAEELKDHNAALSHDWIGTMSKFIESASKYNAIQENKYLLYYGQTMLEQLQKYDQKIGRRYLEKSSYDKETGETSYQMSRDMNLYNQYTNWMRRLIYGQFKTPNGNFTKFANFVQSLTSNTYMMVNVRGGIANVTQGDIQIFTEAFAKDYFGKADFFKGRKHWLEGIRSFAKGIYSDKAFGVEDAIVRFMNIVDFDEINGVVDIPDTAKWFERSRNAMFAPQSIGEHYMQNSALFSMMESHRIIYDENKHRYRAMNFNDYIRGLDEKVLLSMVSAEEYEAFLDTIKDPNKMKDYARFRKNTIVDFLLSRGKMNNINEFNAKYRAEYEKAKEAARKEFFKQPTLYSECRLGSDGMLDFSDDGVMKSKMNMVDRYNLLGEFKQRVISVNKKIHGNYDKMSAAQIEKEWWGSLVMQYHKHIYPGFMKHYRTQGYFNEERGTVEKGMYTSLWDFICLDFNKIGKDLNWDTETTDNIKGIQKAFHYITTFCTNIKPIWNVLPDFERANIKRSLIEIGGYITAVMLAAAVKIAGDDDDEGAIGFITNLAIYETDRMGSEAMQYMPWGAWAEGKRLWSSPVACESRIADIVNSMGVCAQMLMYGDDFDPTYQSGRFAGENKSTVYLKRSIPIYRQIDALVNIADDNHYFKLQNNFVGQISDAAAEFIDEDYEIN